MDDVIFMFASLQEEVIELAGQDEELQEPEDLAACVDIQNDEEYDQIIAEVDAACKTKGEVLSDPQREKLPKGAFALIQKRNGQTLRRFPIHDAAHARNALARLPQAKDLSDAEKAQIKRKAQEALDKFNKTEGNEEIAQLRIRVAQLTALLEDETATSKVQATVIAERETEIRALQEQVTKAQGIEAALAEAQKNILGLRRSQEIGEALSNEQAQVVATMSEAQFGLYLEARKAEKTIIPPRRIIGTDAVVEKTVKVTL